MIGEKSQFHSAGVLGGDPEDDVGWCTFFDRKNFLATMMPQASPAIAITTCTAGSFKRTTIDRKMQNQAKTNVGSPACQQLARHSDDKSRFH
jgi:hypothetical protein